MAVVRALGMAGFTIYSTGRSVNATAATSRFCHESATVPDALEDPAGYAEEVRKLVDRWQIAVLLPMTEASILAILGASDLFCGVKIPFPGLEIFRRISDKHTLSKVAPTLGIAVPQQHVLNTQGDASTVDLLSLRFPLVAKPARSVGESRGRSLKVGVRHAADAAELRNILGELPHQAYPLLLQQRVVGPGVGVFLLVSEGRTMAAFSHRRIREKPPAGGVSVYRESIALDPMLLARSRALLDAFDWQGVAMVEYKIDAMTGTAYLMEVNGRFWGSLQLAVDAGVDFPRLLVDLALGREVEPVMTYRTGIRSRWWWGDVDHLLLRMLRSDRRLSLPPGTPGKARALLDFLKLWRPGDRSEIMRLNDPMPFLYESWNWLRNQ